MQIITHTRTFENTDELRERVERRLRFALDAFGDHVQAAHVQLEDVNGPRGGVDKRCQISVAVDGAGIVMARASAATVISAVSRASRRLKYRVSETLRHAHRPATDSIRRMDQAMGRQWEKEQWPGTTERSTL
jgi:putative sigma-54 modulation protein